MMSNAVVALNWGLAGFIWSAMISSWSKGNKIEAMVFFAIGLWNIVTGMIG